MSRIKCPSIFIPEDILNIGSAQHDLEKIAQFQDNTKYLVYPGIMSNMFYGGVLNFHDY